MNDIDGLFRGKHLSGEKAAALPCGGVIIASAVFDWDIADKLNVLIGFTGFPDVGLQLDLDSARQLP